MKKYDLVVIGFGKAGKTLAAKYGATGKSVAIIERDEKMFGGTCINVGCIPSKSLINSAQKIALMGLKDFDERTVEYAKAIGEKRRVTGMLRKKNFDKLNDMENVQVILGDASFVGRSEVHVERDGKGFDIYGEKILINTGSTSVVLPIEGVKGNPYVFTSNGLLDLDILPKRLVIIGGGYIGLEFASMYNAFGSDVTVLQDGKDLIPREDRDVADEIQKILEARGVTFHLGAKIESIEKGTGNAVVNYSLNGEKISLEGEAVLLATGRKANTENLNLGATCVDVDQRGGIIVNDKLQTTAPSIWAAGDVNGGLQFTYISLDDFRIIWNQLNGNDTEGSYDRTKRENVPYSVFLSPTFSRVGINEDEARKAGIDIKVVKMQSAAIPKAQVLGKTEGFLKAIIHRDTDKILGAMLLCEDSHEMINVVKLAMDVDGTSELLANQVFTHPTMSEGLNDLFSL